MPRFATLQGLIGAVQARGARPAVVAFTRDGATTWSGAELGQAARRLAAGLAAAGVAPGEPVALYAPNSPEWVLACLALFECGAPVMPLDAQLGSDELRLAFEDSGARRVFTSTRLLSRLDALGLDPAPDPILLDAGADDASGLQRLLASAPADLPRLSPEHPAALFYTSGTTGAPKGVPLTHRNLTANLEALLEQGLATEQDRILTPLPLHHVYPFATGMLTPLALGAPLILPYSLTGPQVLRALNEGEATVIIGVPRLYAALFAAIEARLGGAGAWSLALFRAALWLSTTLRQRFGSDPGRHLFAPLHRRFGPRLRMLASGGAALDPALAWKLEALGWRIATGYGLTETSPILTFNPPGRARLDSAGYPLPGVELRVAAPEPDMPHGEVQARGPNVFAGYRNRPEQTEAAFTADGWFRTGDLGYLDADGYLHLTGRASELIVLSGGENINPERLEARLAQDELIREAGVLAVDDALAAVVVPELAGARGDTDLDASVRAALERIAHALPSHHRIGDYVISPDPLPRTRLGKLRRHKLDALFNDIKRQGGRVRRPPGLAPLEALAPEDQQLLQDEAAAQTWQWLGERLRDVYLTPDLSPRYDLGVDSMGWLNLTLELRERTGIDLEDEAIARVDTVRDLLREVSEAERGTGQAADLIAELRDPETLLDAEQKAWLAPPGALAALAGRLLFAVDRRVIRGPFRLQVEGAAHIPAQGQVVFIANHLSYLDAPALAAALPAERLQQTYWGGWTGLLFASRRARAFSRATRVLPVEQRGAGRSALAFGAAALARGHSLVWFPEGQRSPDGMLQRFQLGIGLLLQAHPVPVVPAWIKGTYQALPAHRRWPRLHTVRIAFGPPLDPVALQASGPGDTAQERIANSLRSHLLELGDSLGDRQI